MTSSGVPAAATRPAVQQHHVVGEARDEVELVADEQHGLPSAREAAEQLEHGHLVADVEEGGRLVEHERLAALRERAREPHALPLAAGQLVDRAIHVRLDLRRASIAPAMRVGVDPRRGVPEPEVRIASERDVLAHDERERRLLALRDDGDAARERRARRRERAAPSTTMAPLRQRHAADQRAHERALAAAVRTDDRGERARGASSETPSSARTPAPR